MVCNYLFIYGHGGCPELGAQGAAIGTVIARILELMIIVGYLYREKSHSLFQEDFSAKLPITEGLYQGNSSNPGRTVFMGLNYTHPDCYFRSFVIGCNCGKLGGDDFYQYLKVIV